MKRKNKKYKSSTCMNENSYKYVYAQIPNIIERINEDLFRGFGTRLGLAAKELGMKTLQKAHEFNRSVQQTRIQHANNINNRLLYSSIHRETGFTPKEIINLQYSSSPSERALAQSIKSSVLSQNRFLASQMKDATSFNQTARDLRSVSTRALTNPIGLSGLSSSNNPNIGSYISNLLKINPRKAAETYNRKRNMLNRQRKQDLISRGINKYRIALETGLV